MDLSVIILTWNSERYVESCLRALFSSMSATACRYEIMIVDNGSTDSTTALIRRIAAEAPGRIELTCLPTNIGTTRSRNSALIKALGRHICIIDADVETAPDTFGTLLPVLEADPGIGLAVPMICYPNGTWQKSWDRFPTLPHKINRFLNLKNMERCDAERYQAATEKREVDYAISAFWLFRRDLLASVGFLDERIFYAPEDVDYCMRIWKAGYRIVYVPGARVIHHTQEISRGWGVNRAKLRHLQGLAYLFVKHGYLFHIPNIRPPQSTAAGGVR